MSNPSDPQPVPSWTPRRVANATLALLCAVGGLVVHVFFPGTAWAGYVLSCLGTLLLGLAVPNSPVDAFLDRTIGPDDAPTARMTEEDERAIREALEPRPRPVKLPSRRERGHAAIELLAAVVSFAVAIALWLSGGPV